MRKFKYILAFLILVTATLVIRGGTKAKQPCVMHAKATGLIKATVVQGFPDLVSFSSFINQ